MPEEEVGLRLDLKNRRETAMGLRDVDGSLDRLDRRTATLNRGMSTLGKTSRTVFRGMALGIGAAGFAAYRIGKDALAEAREAQKIGRTTAAILKSTRGAAKLTRKEYDGLVDSLMHKTALDDEQIAQSGNLLLTFKKVRREGKGLSDIFGRSLASALDLSAANFGSTDSAAKMLGKALNDPIKGVTALSRAGVTFSEGQKDTIASLVEHNDLLGAQKLILKEVESQVGGTAARQKTSAMELEVAWGNLKEEIGYELIPVAERFSRWGVREGIPMVRDFAGWIRDDAVPAIGDFVTEVRPLGEKLLPAAGDALEVMHSAGKKLLPVAEGIVDAFNGMPDWAKKALIGGVGAGILAKKSGLLSLLTGGKGGGGLLSGMKPVPVIVTNPGFNVPGRGPGGTTVVPGGGDKPYATGNRTPDVDTPKTRPGRWSFVKDIVKGSAKELLITAGVIAGVEQYTDAVQRYSASVRKWEEFGNTFHKNATDALESGDIRDQPFTWQLDAFGNLQVDTTNDFAWDKYLPKDADVKGFMRIKDELSQPLITRLSTAGIPESKAALSQLIRMYDNDLDNRTVRTLIKALGLDDAIWKADKLGQHLNALDGRIVDIKVQAQQLRPGLPSPGAPSAPDQPNRLPKVDPGVLPNQNTEDRSGAPAASSGASTDDQHYHFYLDGREVTEAVVTRMESREARL